MVSFPQTAGSQFLLLLVSGPWQMRGWSWGWSWGEIGVLVGGTGTCPRWVELGLVPLWGKGVSGGVIWDGCELIATFRQPEQIFIKRWMNKEDGIKSPHTYNGILLSHKKTYGLSILNEISQTEKDKSYDITCMENLEIWPKWTYLQNRNRFTDIENKFMVIKSKEREGWIRSLGLADINYYI